MLAVHMLTRKAQSRAYRLGKLLAIFIRGTHTEMTVRTERILLELPFGCTTTQ